MVELSSRDRCITTMTETIDVKIVAKEMMQLVWPTSKVAYSYKLFTLGCYLKSIPGQESFVIVLNVGTSSVFEIGLFQTFSW